MSHRVTSDWLSDLRYLPGISREPLHSPLFCGWYPGACQRKASFLKASENI